MTGRFFQDSKWIFCHESRSSRSAPQDDGGLPAGPGPSGRAHPREGGGHRHLRNGRLHLGGKMPSRMPLIPGHECTGVVEDTGEGVSLLKKGDRVVLNPLVSCEMPLLPAGADQPVLERRPPRPGAAGHLRRVHRRPRDGCLYHSGERELRGATNFVGLATVVYSQRKAPYIPGGSVAILGQGSTGLLHTQLAKASGAASVIAVTRSRWKLEMAQKMGADHIVPAGEGSPVEAVLGLTEGWAPRW